MYQIPSSRRRSLRLSIRISLSLIVAAILPLLIAVIINELQAFPTLINQASTTLQTDTRTHAQLIDNYLAAKLLEVRTLDNTPVVQQYFSDPAHNQAALTTLIQNGLAINKSNDPDILLVTHFDLRGHYLFHYSIYGLKPQPHGKHLLPPTDLQNLLKSKSLQYVSGVYYDPQTKQSTVDLYTIVYSTTLKKPLGVIRDTLSLSYIWSIVEGEQGANGSGSSAFILDQNGVRIIDPNPKRFLTAIASLGPQAQQQIQNQHLYGSNTTLPVLADATLQHIQSQQHPSASFQEVPAGENELYQVARQPLTPVPWTYFVMMPVSVEVAVANQQLLTLTLIALAVVIPVAVLGWIIGKRISSPILRSVESLTGNSTALNELADREEHAASEQLWIVDASKVGFHSVEYYAKASKKAIWRLNDLGKELLLQQQKGAQPSFQDIQLIVNIGQYLEKAADYQEESNRKVATAIKVTNEVTEQLAAGAKSTKEVANELDQVVKQLRRIVGS